MIFMFGIIIFDVHVVSIFISESDFNYVSISLVVETEDKKYVA